MVGILTVASLLVGCIDSQPVSDPRAADDAAYAVVFPARAVDAPPERVARELGAVRWESDVLEGKRRAESERRSLLVFVHAHWSTDSQRIENQVMTDARVLRAASLVVPVKLDASVQDTRVEEAMASLGVDAVPTLVLLDSGHREIARLGAAATVSAVVDLLRKSAAR